VHAGIGGAHGILGVHGVWKRKIDRVHLLQTVVVVLIWERRLNLVLT
jgi:hypothetical protein